MVEQLTDDHKIKGSKPTACHSAPVEHCNKLLKYGGSIVVEHSITDPKIEASNQGKEKDRDKVVICGVGTVVEQLTTDHEIKGSNPASCYLAAVENCR